MTAYLELMRPKQWIKNSLVLAGPMMGLKSDLPSAWHTLVMLVAFCLVSSASYVINDIVDRRADALHPDKRHRPLAAGRVGLGGAAALAALLAGVGFGLAAWFLPRAAVAIVAAYFVLVLSYSLALKRRVILDVIVIAVGFVLRAVAGAAAVEVVVSPWLLVCTFTLCLFLGFGKRRTEVAALARAGTDPGAHRATLRRYTPELLNQLTSVSAGIAVITFLLYTLDHDPAVVPPFPKHQLLYSVPLVAYGLFRYTMLTQSGEGGAGPSEILLHDRPLLATIALFGLFLAAVVWQAPLLALLGIGAG